MDVIVTPPNPSKWYQVRSISFPARGPASAITVAKELKTFKSWLASSPSPQVDTVCNGLEGLNQIYNSIECLLSTSPQTLQSLSNSQHEKLVKEIVDGSIMYIDICSKSRDMMFQMRECTGELQSSLRRKRGGGVDIESNVRAYAWFRKNMSKEMERSLASLKQMENIFVPCPQMEKDQLRNVVQILREANSVTILILQKLLLLHIQKPKPSSRWSLAVSKLMTREEKEGQNCSRNELEDVDIEVMNLEIHSSTQVNEDCRVNLALNKLKSLDRSIKSFESGLECLFKHLINMRVAFLNISSTR